MVGEKLEITTTLTQFQLFSDLKSFPIFCWASLSHYTNPPLAGGLLVWIVPRTHHAYHYIHRSVGSQDDINNDDNDVSNDVNASLRCRVIDDYLSFGCDWSHAMYLLASQLQEYTSFLGTLTIDPFKEELGN